MRSRAPAGRRAPRTSGRSRPRRRRSLRSPAAHRCSRTARATLSLLRRLQSEAQIVFHSHAVNEAREERGELTANSFWLSGCGRRQAADAAHTPEIAATLRAPLLHADWAAWAEAWRTLDGADMARLLALARRGEAVTLTLCGERSAARYALAPRSLWQRLRATTVAAHDVLAAL